MHLRLTRTDEKAVVPYRYVASFDEQTGSASGVMPKGTRRRLRDRGASHACSGS